MAAALHRSSPCRSLPFPTAENIAQELEIHVLAQGILTMPTSPERKAALEQLHVRRAQLLTHVPVNGLKEMRFFLNMKQIGLTPTPICPAYNRLRAPTLSDYGTPAANIALITLDASALQYVPQEVQAMAGNLSGKCVDLFWTVIDGRHLATGRPHWHYQDRPINQVNLVTHPWSFPHAHPENECKRDIHMGISPEFGFEPVEPPGAIALHSMSPMEVYIHPPDGAAPPSSSGTLYSPDNAHFTAIRGSPLGLLWVVCKIDERISITKMTAIFDHENLICKALLKTIQNCDTLDTHLERLALVSEAVDQFLQPVIALIQDDDARAISEFIKLPPTFQNEIFKEAWMLQGSPHGIHNEFGKLSFFRNATLDARYHCNDAFRSLAIERFGARLNHLLCDSQIDLLLHSQPLVRGDNILPMMQCAHMIQTEQELAAQTHFQSFSSQQREATFLATWELSGCPRGNNNFGQETFTAELPQKDLKSQALLLAASRQVPLFAHPVITPLALPEQRSPQDILGELAASRQVPLFAHPVITPLALPEQRSPQDILGELIAMQEASNFTAEQINALLRPLPQETKTEIYKTVFEHSTAPNKGGPSWAENHIADDINLVIQCLLQTLNP